MPRSKITPHLIDRAQFSQRQPSSFKLHSAKTTFAGINVKLSEHHYDGVANAIAKYGFSQKNYSIMIKIVRVWMGDAGIEIVDRVFKGIKDGTVSQKEAKEKFLEFSKQGLPERSEPEECEEPKEQHEGSAREVLRRQNIETVVPGPSITPKTSRSGSPDITPRTSPIPLPTIVPLLPVCAVPTPRIPRQLHPLSTRSQFLYEHTMTINGIKRQEIMHFTITQRPHQQPIIKVRQGDLSGTDKLFTSEVLSKTDKRTLNPKDIAQV